MNSIEGLTQKIEEMTELASQQAAAITALTQDKLAAEARAFNLAGLLEVCQTKYEAADSKRRSIYDWLHLVETKIGTPTAAMAARVLKEFYEGAEPEAAPQQHAQAAQQYDFAKLMMYPEEWDTAAYPTLESAMWEAIGCAQIAAAVDHERDVEQQVDAQAAQAEINDALDRADTEDDARFGAQAALSHEPTAWRHQLPPGSYFGDTEHSPTSQVLLTEAEAIMERESHGGTITPLGAILATRQPAPDLSTAKAALASFHDYRKHGGVFPSAALGILENIVEAMKVAPVAAAVQGDVRSLEKAVSEDDYASLNAKYEKAKADMWMLVKFVRDARDAIQYSPEIKLDTFPTSAQRSQVMAIIRSIPGMLQHSANETDSAYQQGRAAGIEEAAKLLDPKNSADDWTPIAQTKAHYAAEIRALNNQGG